MSDSDGTPLDEGTPDVYTSPLRIMLSEMNEVYEELVAVGFTDRIATMIVAQQ